MFNVSILYAFDCDILNFTLSQFIHTLLKKLTNFDQVINLISNTFLIKTETTNYSYKCLLKYKLCNFRYYLCRVGRRTCIILTFVGVVGCMLGISFSKSIAVYITCRVAAAIFIYGSELASFVYCK